MRHQPMSGSQDCLASGLIPLFVKRISAGLGMGLHRSGLTVPAVSPAQETALEMPTARYVIAQVPPAGVGRVSTTVASNSVPYMAAVTKIRTLDQSSLMSTAGSGGALSSSVVVGSSGTAGTGAKTRCVWP